MKTIVFTNIFNEEYLLPFWLEHHKNIFDHGVIIDYHSTDKSLEICKEMVPTWDIITTRNKDFDAINIDLEFMDIEKTYPNDIKIVLNTTEFIFSLKPLETFFNSDTEVCYQLRAWSPFPNSDTYPKTLAELFKPLLHFVQGNYEYRLGHRFIHNYEHGDYGVGRHWTNRPVIPINEIGIVWFGFYPWNEYLIKRKTQIGNNVSSRDKEKKWGFQHLWGESKLEQEITEQLPKSYNLPNESVVFQYIEKY